MNSISFYKALLMKEIDEELKGGQKKLDVAEPKGKITGADFKALRKKKDIKEGDTPKHKIMAQIMGPDFYLSKKPEREWDEKDYDMFDRYYKMASEEGQVPVMKTEADMNSDQIRPDLKSAYDQGYKAGYAKCKYDMSGEFPDIFESQDHEVSMAHNSLKSIVSSASQLMNMLGQDEKDIPAWIQDHITNAENFINQASKNYHEYNENEHDVDELPDGTIEEPVDDMTLQSMMEDLLKTKK
jgi:hypothetical protein